MGSWLFSEKFVEYRNKLNHEIRARKKEYILGLYEKVGTDIE